MEKDNQEIHKELNMLGMIDNNLLSETLKLARDNQRDKKRCETLNNNLKEKLELIS